MAPSPQAEAVTALLREALTNSGTAWSLGSFGAIAEFMRDPDEAVSALPDDRMGLATERGAIALTACSNLRPVAYETSVASGWNHAVALCLPEATSFMSRRNVVTELGPDRDAAREREREAIMFDLGLDLLAVDACVRTSDPDAIACLRSGIGQPLFDHANSIGRHLVAMSPHRVFLAKVGRIEVYAPIPGPGGTSPEARTLTYCPNSYEAGARTRRRHRSRRGGCRAPACTRPTPTKT